MSTCAGAPTYRSTRGTPGAAFKHEMRGMRHSSVGLAMRCVVVSALVSAGVCLAAEQDAVIVSQSGAVVAIENARIKVAYDLSAGTYIATDKKDDAVCISDAYTSIDGVASNAGGFDRTWSSRPVADALGSGRTLTINCSQKGKRSLILEITLYADSGFISLAAGVDNATSQDIRVHDIHPLVGGEAFAGEVRKMDCKTLNGPAGGGRTWVAAGPTRRSPNNVLLTFTSEGKRRSLVLGGLTYHEFLKYVRLDRAEWTEQARRAQLESRAPAGGRLASYLECGVSTNDGAEGSPRLRLIRGAPYTFEGAEAIAAPWFGSVVFDDKEVVFEASGLDPGKTYILGFSWWDYNKDGRVQSLYAAAGHGAEGKLLLNKQALPAYYHDAALPEERTLTVPQEVYASGSMEILFTNEAPVPNAVVSEVWLWAVGGRPGNGRPSATRLTPGIIRSGQRVPADSC